ncbi:hypothetical protein AMAG_15988 [Allomyces macrogynus ATCC 38327]|uniref:Uncharacterized protein n=1 Tax=Allomyces macrogynus (strain ATCC 38327) TaxID=578462 RepID=A0A0L0TBC1_ALLM3|nr:hypothetical protein AMAG_15988 [Allomyces macrogynus ATCC 38327]|eukprot:KNE72047.1 hypothetical protein AMAG_15988 [Allomyces macrogynus ATCC 38327]
MSRVSVKFLSLLLLAVLVSATSLEDCVKSFDKNKDCFTTRATTDDAKLYSVEYKNYYKVVTVKKATGAVAATYNLLIRGAPKDGLPASNGTFEIPVKSVAVMDTTSVPYIEVLGQRGAVAAADSEALVTSACFQKLVKDKKIASVDSTNAAAAAKTLNGVDAIFTGFGMTVKDVDGSKVVAQYASSDPGMLNRAEWLEYFAQWFGLEAQAQATTQDIDARYKAAKDAAKRAAPTTPLNVAWISYAAPSSFNNNTASWSFSAAAYKKALVEDAGGKLMTPDTASFTDAEAFRKALTDADVVVDETFTGTSTFDEFTKTFGVSDAFKFVKNRQVYRLDKRVNPDQMLDWFESAIVFPNQVLVDMMTVLTPTAVPDGTQRRYIRKVDAEQPITVTADQCTGDVNAAQAVVGPEANAFSALPKGGSTKSSGAVAGVSAASGLSLAAAGAIVAGALVL